MKTLIIGSEKLTYQALCDLYEVKTVEKNGQTWAYRESGEGPAIVLLHGISSGSASWINQLEALEKSYRVIAWDALGYGQSSVFATDKPNAADYADALHQLCEMLDVKNPLIIGHSLGCMAAAAYYSKYEQSSRGLILVDPAQGYANFDEANKEEVYQKRPQLLARLGYKEMAKQRGLKLFSQHTAENIWLVEYVMSQLTQHGFTHASYLLAYDSIEHYLNTSMKNVFFIYGEQDGITLPADIKRLASTYQFIHVYGIDHAGHISYLDQPSVFNNLLKDIEMLIN